MNISSIRSYKNDYFEDDNKIDINLSINIIDNFITYLFTRNPLVNNKTLSNMRSLLSIIDLSKYEEDPELCYRIDFIQKVLKCRLDKNIQDFYLILDYTREGKYSEEIEEYIIPILDNEDFQELSTEEIKFLNKYISERLKYSYLYNYKEELREYLDLLDNEEFDSLEKLNNDITSVLQLLVGLSKKVEIDEEDNRYFDFSEESISTIVKDLLVELKKPTNYLKTGLQYLNQMFNGGFEAGRCYLFLGVAKSFKSGLLLTIADWIKKFNKDIKPKDRKKRPLVLFVTQENSLKETLARYCSMNLEDNIVNEDEVDNIIDKIYNEELITNDENNPIELRFVYKRNLSISTNDLYYMIDELEEIGYEVIALIHDYSKRIRPSVVRKELRLDLAQVIDDFCTLAKTRNIPVITAGQLNREAARTIENMIDKGINDIGKKLGSSNIGESWGMIENADVTCIVNKEFRPADESWFLTIKLCQTRSKLPEITYFAHPFDKDNSMRVIPDINKKKPLSLLEVSSAEIDTDIDEIAEKKKENNKFFNGKKKLKNYANEEDDSDLFN